MRAAPRHSLLNFLNYFQKSHECGLVIINKHEDLPAVMDTLKSTGFAIAQSWRGVLHHLALEAPVAYYVNESLSEEELNLVLQYQQYNGLIQLLEQPSGESITIHCDTTKARLLLLMLEEDLRSIDSSSDLMAKVGMIEYI